MKPDHEFMDSLSAAVLEQTNRGAKLIIYVIAVVVVAFIFWAYKAELDQITRGVGKIVPFSKNQVIQNLEGGIVEEILVTPGAIVEKGQPLLRIDNKAFASNLAENRLKVEELSIKRARLEAEVSGEKFLIDEETAKLRPELVTNEKQLLQTNLDFLNNQVSIILDQISQKKNSIANARVKVSHLIGNRKLLEEQMGITRPLVEKGVEARSNLIKLERELNSLNQDIDATKGMINGFNGEIQEAEKKIEEFRISFKTRAQKELNDVIAVIAQIDNKEAVLSDQVVRALVLSPVKAIVKQIFVNTIGGVVRPGMDLFELVPIADSLLIEAKISPSDIAFIGPDQEATIKVTAYDYSVFGGLKGKVIDISADTLTEANGTPYYLVRLKTEKSTLRNEEKELRLIPGMIVSVDILTGKKTVLDYLLKPILKAKQVALTER